MAKRKPQLDPLTGALGTAPTREIMSVSTGAPVNRNLLYVKAEIDAIVAGLKASAGGVVSVAGKTGIVTLAESDIAGLAADLAAAYTAANPPPYPVSSVAGKTGSVTLTEADIAGLTVDLANHTASIIVLNTITSGITNVPHGGTGVSGLMPYGVLTGGTTASGNVQQVNGTGVSGTLLMSMGASQLPQWQPAPSGGQTTVKKIVAASGGDYTTLSAAITAASDGWSIYVRGGTYTEAGVSSAINNLNIIGDGNATVVLNFGANSLTLSGNQPTITGVTMTATTGILTISGGNAFIQANAFTKAANNTSIFLSSKFLYSPCVKMVVK